MTNFPDYSPNNDFDLRLETHSDENVSIVSKSLPFPRHWDDIPQQRVHFHETFHFSERFVSDQLQPEYWWSRSEHACESKCLKGCWFRHTSTEDDRYELTEYQVVREVIWALMGAERTFVFQHMSNPQNVIGNLLVCATKVSVKHLTPPTLDSMLNKFSIPCTHANILRLLLRNITASCNCHPCIIMFSSKIRSFLSSFEKFLCELEKTACGGPENLTLIVLWTQISTWSSRLHMIVDLVGQFTLGRLSSLNDKSSFIRLLDILYIFASTTDYCTDDKWLINFLHSLFFHCFYPILSSVVHLLSGSLNVIHLKRLFVKVDLEKLPTDPLSWHHLCIELGKCSSDVSSIPKILNAKLLDLISGVRSLGIIVSLATTMNRVSLLDPVRNSVAVMMRQLDVSLSHVFDSARVNPVPLNFKAVTLPSFQHDDFELVKEYLWTSLQRVDYTSPTDICINCGYSITSFQKILHEVIAYRCGAINQYLMQLLITPTGYVILDSRHLGSALSAVLAVYLFGASDKMCDFLRDRFIRKLDVEAWSNDLFGMTLGLRSSFEKLSKGFLHGGSHCDLFLVHIQRFSFRLMESSEGNHQKGTHNQDGISGLESVFLAFDTEWPIDCIIDSRSVATYNSVFNFMVQIKYVKWSVETLPFNSLESVYVSDPLTHHRLLLMRISMLYIFTSLHDFLLHRIESLRAQFSNRWHLPDVNVQSPSNDTSRPLFPGDLSQLVRYHDHFLEELASLCLLTEDGSMLRTEVTNLCRMVFTMRSLWLGAKSVDQRQLQFQTDLTRVTSDFVNHVKFLATLLSRCVTHSGASRLLPLAETFSTASAFTSLH